MVITRGCTYFLFACLLSFTLFAETGISHKNAESSIVVHDNIPPLKINSPVISSPSSLTQSHTKSDDSGGIPWPMILLLLFVFSSLGFICIREILKNRRYPSSKIMEDTYAPSRSYGSNNHNTTCAMNDKTMKTNDQSSLSYQQETHFNNKSLYNSNDYGIYRNVFNTISERLQHYREQNANRPLGTSSMMFEHPAELPTPALICPPINSKWRKPLTFSEKRIGYEPENISLALHHVLTRNLKQVKEEEKEIEYNYNNMQYIESKKKWKRSVSDSSIVGRILKTKNDAHVYSSITHGGKVLFDSSDDEDYDDSDGLLEDNEISDVLNENDVDEDKQMVSKMVVIDID